MKVTLQFRLIAMALAAILIDANEDAEDQQPPAGILQS